MVNEVNNLSTVNLSRTRLRLRDDLVFISRTHWGKIYYLVEAVDKSHFYRIGYPEYVFISLLDGECSFAEALALAAQRLGSASLATSQATTIYLWLLENKLGTLVDRDGYTDPSVSVGSRNIRKHPGQHLGRPRIPNPFWIKIPFGNPDAVIRILLPYFAWLYSPAFTVFGWLLIAIAAMKIGYQWEQFWSDSTVVFSLHNWLWLTAAWLGLKIVHELGHAFACRYHGGEVKELGAVLMLFAPSAYVDVTSCWRFSSKWSRIHVAIAGIYFELLIAALAALAWQNVESKFLTHMLFNVIFMASFSTILFNANPLMRFDGYFILSDLMHVPNLSSEGSRRVRQHCAWFLFGRNSGEPRSSSALAWWIGVYGWAAAVWQVVVGASLVIAASVLFAGAGVALSALAIASWIGKPAWRTFQHLMDKFGSDPAQAWRAIAIATLVCLVVSFILVAIPSPATVLAPGIVEYRDVEHVRSLTGGFIREILVADGQTVVAGDLLLIIDNPEVSNLYHDLYLAIEQAEIKHQIAVDRHEASAAQIAQGEIRALREQFSEAKHRYEALEVTAPVTGTISRRGLHQALGTYVQAGEQLLSMGNEASKELIVSIDQRDFDSVTPRIDSPVRIRLGTHPVVIGRLERVEPRASKQLIHPSLAAIEGGPLEVVALPHAQADANSDSELTEPRFRAVVSLPANHTSSIFCGQRANATIGTRSESIGVTVYQSIADWMKDKLSSARS